jgi:hypothetical protein
MRAHLAAALIGIACIVAPAAPRAALVQTSGPASPGTYLDVSLTWPTPLNVAIDEIDINLGPFDSSVLATPTVTVHPGGLLDSADGCQTEFACLIGTNSTVSFLHSQLPFGPGELLDYRFQVLSVPENHTTTISVEVIPAMGGDGVPVGDLPASLTNPSLVVQIVPEPSSGLLAVIGVLLIGAIRARSRTI